MYKIVAAILSIALAQTCIGQQVVPLTKMAESVKQKADKLATHARISVVQLHAGEQFGEFVSNDQQGFTFYDVDRKADVSLQYSEVRKIKDGYGGYNSIHRTHTDRTRGLIFVLAIAGVLVGVIVAAAVSK